MTAAGQRARCLVTGATGAAGGPVLDELLARDWLVRALVHRAPCGKDGVETVRGSLLDFRREWLDGVDAVIHLAAATDGRLPAAEHHRVNVDGTRRLVEALQATGRDIRLVFASTAAVDIRPAGGRTGPPATAYGRSKLEAEGIVLACRSGVVVRLPLIVGPHDRYQRKFRAFIRLRVFPIVDSRFSALHELDLARLFAHLAAAPPAANRLWTVTDGEVYGWRDVVAHFAGPGRRVLQPRIPAWLLRPWLFGLFGHRNAARYLRQDWHCAPNYPEGFQPQHQAFRRASS